MDHPDNAPPDHGSGVSVATKNDGAPADWYANAKTSPENRMFGPGTSAHWTPNELKPNYVVVTHKGGTLEAADSASTLTPDCLSMRPVDWLLQRAGNCQSPRELMRDLCGLLTYQGFPLLRVTAFIMTLHPQTRGVSMTWWRDKPDPSETTVLRGIENTAPFLRSPLPAIFEGAAAIRRRLDLPDVVLDYPILEDLKNEGATDYVAMPLHFSGGQINFITWCSDQPGGFTGEQLSALYDLLPALALRLEVLHKQRLTNSLLEVYLGKDAGHRVLSGAIERGQSETLNAVIWFSDLRGFTQMSDSLPKEEIVDLLNGYFECMAVPVEERGGQILKFVGDGVLAIFPYDHACPIEMSEQALKAAFDARLLMEGFNKRRAAAGKVTLRYGLGLHLGEVAYGNIGSLERLDFTVIGPAVNLANRLQALAKRLDSVVVTSGEFAKACPRPFISLGRHDISGLDHPVEAFRPWEESKDLPMLA